MSQQLASNSLTSQVTFLDNKKHNKNFNMHEEKFNTSRWFWIFCLIHILAWTILPTLFFPILYGDTTESIAWGLQWQLGYTKHPPLAAWIAALATKIGPYTRFQIYLLGSLLTVTAFWAIWRLANRILTPGKALVSVLLLEGALYYNCYSVYIDPDTIQIPIWALTFLTYYIALKEEKVYQWVLVGILCALAVYGKYQAILIFIPMVIVILFTQEGRRQLFKPGIYICFIVYLLLISPHFIWAYFHDFPEIQYAFNATHDTAKSTSEALLKGFESSINFIGAQIGFCILLFLLAISFLFVKRDKSYNIGSFNKRYILIMGLGPLIVTVLFPILFKSEIVWRWGFASFSLMGIIAMVYIKPIITEKIFKRFAYLLILVIIIIASSYCLSYGYWFSYVNGNYRNWNLFPAKSIAEKTTEIWHEHYKTPFKYVAGSHYLIIGITVYSKDHPIPLFDWNKKESLWVNIDDLKKNGAIFTWWVDGLDTVNDTNMLPEVRKQFPRFKDLGVFRFEKVGIPKDNKPILKTYLKEHYPELLAKPVIKQFFPDYPPYVDIGIGILPPKNSLTHM